MGVVKEMALFRFRVDEETTIYCRVRTFAISTTCRSQFAQMPHFAAKQVLFTQLLSTNGPK